MIRSKRFWIGLLITAVTLFLAFQGIQWPELISALERINYIWFPLTVLLFWISFGARVLRWQLLFTPFHLRWEKVLATLSIGYFLSNITPLRAGDVVRAYLIGNMERVPVPRALSSVLVERTMDALTVVLLLVALIPVIPHVPDQARSAGAVLGLAGVGLLVALALLSLQRERGIGLLKRMTAPFPVLQRESFWRALENLIDGFAVLHSARPILGVIGWSIVVWFFAVVLNWTIMRAMGITLGLDAAGLAVIIASLAVTAAPTPGQLGVFHLATQFALTSVYGVDKSVALAFAFVVHAYVYLWTMALGVFFIWREGLSYARLQTTGAEGNARVGVADEAVGKTPSPLVRSSE